MSSDTHEASQPRQLGALVRMRRLSPVALLGRGARLLVLLAFAAFFGLPLIWLVIAPTKTDDQLVSWSPFAIGNIGHIGEAWSHLLLFNDAEILTWAVNSVLYAGTALVLTVLISLLAGYALGTARFAGRRPLLLVTLVVMIMPPAAGVLPLFLEVNALHLLNTPLSVILPSAFFPFGVYLAYIYFATSMPPELLAAGRIDGCTELELFWFIGLPLAKPMLGLVAFFSFVANWNNYFLPYVMLTDDRKFNLPVGLVTLIQGTPALNPQFGGSQMPIKRPEAALAGLLVVLPVLVLFLFFQRFVRAEMFGGAEKG